MLIFVQVYRTIEFFFEIIIRI